MSAVEPGIEKFVNIAPPSRSSAIDSRLTTAVIHADDHIAPTTDVAPAIHVSTTFRYAPDPDNLIPACDLKDRVPSDAHVYSRETAPSSTRLEALLAALLHAPTITYSSGLAALHGAYVFLNPRVVSIGGGYHGSHGVLALQSKLTGAKLIPLECAAEELGEGDVIHLETPINPTGEAFNIQEYADKAHSRGAYLLVDSTFGPPGLQDPFKHGADIVMHSGTKYIGGHSDMLCGILASQNEAWATALREERTYLGSVLGSFEGWLGIRSVRTLELRVQKQSENAGLLVGWLAGLLEIPETEEDSDQVGVVKRCVTSVHHASLQRKDLLWLKKQMPNGFGPVFALTMKEENLARTLPSKVQLFHHATSLGGVESLIEWRAMSDKSVDRRIVRLSIGIEAFEDLKHDILTALTSLSDEACKDQKIMR